MPDAVVTLQKYYTLDEAYIARGFLESEGVRACIQDENLVRVFWLYTNAIGGLRLQVGQKDLERASAILEAGTASVEPMEMGAEHCPDCDGLGTSRIVRGRRIAFLSWLVIGVPLCWPHSTWRCSQCGRIQE